MAAVALQGESGRAPSGSVAEAFLAEASLRVLSLLLFVECYSQSHSLVRASGHKGAEAVHDHDFCAAPEAGSGSAGTAGSAAR